MFRFFQPRVYIVAATVLFVTVVAGCVWALHWAYGVEQLKLESCQRLLTALELERPIQVRGLVLKDPDRVYDSTPSPVPSTFPGNSSSAVTGSR